jgi:hypothetical protein
VLNTWALPADTSSGMNTEQIGSFRTRVAGDGSLEVWARGWRLESQLYALIPMGLALMFLVAPMSAPMRALGAVVMLGATLVVFRMTKPGLVLTREVVSIVSVVRTQRFPWERVTGFMGERSHDEARILMMLGEENFIALPGTLDPAELDPYGDEGQELSAADQLNLLQERALAGELNAAASSVPSAPKARPTPSLPDTRSERPTRKEQRAERKELRRALKAVELTPEGTPARAPANKFPDPLPEDATRKEHRNERKALRAALKAVRLTPEGTVVKETTPPDVPVARAQRLSRKADAAAGELVQVAIGEPASDPIRPRAEPQPEPIGNASHFPTPVYIPQAEYAQMLRDQKAAEKAAVAAAAELRRLAEIEELDELAAKEEFSDWTA